MAITTIEGLLEIELADVYGWLSSEFKLQECALGMSFPVEQNSLVIEMADGKDPVYIEAVDFWNWVEKNHMPKGMEGFEKVFGVPKEDKSNYVLSISFAASNATDPRTWAKLPACLMEWGVDEKSVRNQR